MKITEDRLLKEGYNQEEYSDAFSKGQIAFTNFANRVNCDWCMRLDNEDYEGVALIDVMSIEEANEFSLKLIGIKAFENYE